MGESDYYKGPMPRDPNCPFCQKPPMDVIGELLWAQSGKTCAYQWLEQRARSVEEQVASLKRGSGR